MGPLHGLRILEVASFVAGPLCGLTLAQLGADVIRIDPIGGAADQTRWPLAPSGRSIYWAGLNKEKRTIELDLRTTEGRELAVALATADGPDAGIVVTNAVRGDWISYENLATRRPDVIHARLIGLPDGGPAVDYTVNAELGFPTITGPDAFPVNHVLPAWDLLAGMNLALGIVVAERTRRLTGRGESIEVSLWDVGLHAASALGFLGEAQILPEPRPSYGNYYFGGFGRDFSTLDGRVMVVILSYRQWQQLVRALDVQAPIAALGADFSNDSARFDHRREIAAIVAPWFAARTNAEVIETLSAAGVVSAPYRDFQQMAALSGPLVGSNPMLQEIDEDGIGTIRAARTPIGWRGFDRQPIGTSHRLGADTEQVLAEVLGLSQHEIGVLVDRGVLSAAVGASTG